MRIVSFANSKGGAGKSTAIRAVASALEHMGRSVAIVDLDNQQSIGTWLDVNDDGIYPLPDKNTFKIIPMIYSDDEDRNAEQVQAELSKMSDANDFEFILIDTKGASSMTNSVALGSADIVICPTNGDADEVDPIINTFNNFVEISKTVDPDENPKDRFWVMFTKNQAILSNENIESRLALKEHFNTLDGLPQISAFNSCSNYGATLLGMINGWKAQKNGDRTKRAKAGREIAKFEKALAVSVKLVEDIERAIP